MADRGATVSGVGARAGGVPTPTADLMDLLRPGLSSCDLQLRDYGARTRFAGRIRTVRCLDDNVLVRDLLNEPGELGVLVVDGGGSLHTALLGDVIGRAAADHGWAGVVINGAVRDVAALRTLPLGIRAAGSNPRRSGKAGAGEVDVEVSFGGVTFVPGEDLVADEDGIVVGRPG